MGKYNFAKLFHLKLKDLKLYERRLEHYKNNRQNILEGGINGIPIPFTRFRRELPAIEKAKYYGVTGNQKSGKTQLADYLFVLYPLMYAFKNKEQLRLKILYFSLEMSIQQKYDQFTCFWLYYHTHGKIRIDTKQLNSLDENNPVPIEVLELLATSEYKEFFDFIEQNVIFYDNVRNPYGIFKTCKDYALNPDNGKLHMKTIEWRNEKTNEIEERDVIDYYESTDSDEYRIVVVDHVSLLSPEKNSPDLRTTIGKFSSNDCVQLRNNYGFTIVSIQQQAAAQEGIENLKMNRVMPTSDGLADNKTTSRDFDILIGIFSPYRFKIPKYENYNINEFEDNIRFMEVILNRNGTAGGTCPLYFDGAVNVFAELPKFNNRDGLNKFLNIKREFLK